MSESGAVACRAVQGKGVFLTGGARGIGRAIVEALLAAGARVVFCDVNEANGKSTETELQAQYGADNLTFLQCDVTNEQQFKDVWQQTVGRLGAVDVCVNNAAVIQETRWEACIAVNVMGTMRGSLLAYNHMRKDKGGKGGIILSIASDLGLRYGCFSVPTYGTTKHAIVGFMLNMSSDPGMQARGVSWRILCPEAVDTPFMQMMDGQVNMSLTEWSHRCRALVLQLPEDVAAALMTMLGDEFTNGDVMRCYKDKKGEIIRQVLVINPSEDDIPCSLIEKSRTAVAAVSTAGKVSFVPDAPKQ